MSWQVSVGARPSTGGVNFRVWAPDRKVVTVVLYEGAEARDVHPLAQEEGGYWSGHIRGIGPGAEYMYRLDDSTDRPDPASRYQGQGVHGPSTVVDPAFPWTDSAWHGLPYPEMVIYELHTGTVTPAGTFEALIERLPDLRELGINTIEIMPVADFPGDRNWGYDGVDLYAPARVYGGPTGLKRLVDAAHAHGLAVILDVVYNHLGPSGNYLRDYAQDYFTTRHHTSWGDALNYDGPRSRAVRDFFVENALHWAHEYHVDGLRLDATHAIVDDSPVHLLEELVTRIRDTLPPERHFAIIAEDGRNEALLARPRTAGGMGLDGIWADDFHHSVRVTLTGEHEGYYRAYRGGAEELATTLRDGWLYQGQPVPPEGKPRGTPAADLPPAAFVHCIQNHDQIGNRALGNRLNDDVSPAAYRAASALLLLGPYLPLLFMGQEWAASTPFQFFTDHEPDLGRLVTAGRRKEFEHFSAFSGEEVPDPQAPATFERSKLRWHERNAEPHAGVLRLYRDLLDLRRRLPALRNQARDSYSVHPAGDGAVAILRHATVASEPSVLVCVNLRDRATLDLSTFGAGRWEILLDSEAARYGGDTNASALADGLAAPIVLHGPRAVVLTRANG